MAMMARFCLAAFAALLFCGGAARAERGACKADVEKHCKGVKMGGGRIAACLRSHEADLSAECKEAQHEWKEAMAHISEACKEDKAKFCADVKPGGGRIKRCMRKHRKELSEKCQGAFMEERRKHRRGRRGGEKREGAGEKPEGGDKE